MIFKKNNLSFCLGAESVLRQAKECHTVLRCIQTIMSKVQENLKNEVWRLVLRFLLSINDQLLSPPGETGIF